MAGMTGKKPPGAASKKHSGGGGGATGGGVKANQKQGQQGGVQSGPAGGGQGNVITSTWQVGVSNINNTVLVFSQPVVWNGLIPNAWSLKTGTTAVAATKVTQVAPNQFAITWAGPANKPNTVVVVPQNDQTFKGQQGQVVNPGSFLPNQ